MGTIPSDPSDQHGIGDVPEAPRASKRRGKAIQAPELDYHEVEQNADNEAEVDAAYDILFEAVLRVEQGSSLGTRLVSTEFLREVMRN